MHSIVIAMRLLCLLLAATVLGCTSSCAPESKPSSVAEQAAREFAAVSEHVEMEEGEEREAEDERRGRAKALLSLRSYKPDSCQAAVAQIESALRAGNGRWHERDEQGALAADLLTHLVEAELWRDQAKPLCASDPLAARYDALRLLMDGIWRYPLTLPREELDKRLAVLGK